MSTLGKRVLLVFVIIVVVVIAAFMTCNSGGSKKESTKKERTKSETRKNKKETDNVYICNSEGGKHYHSEKNCTGLNRCTHDIVKISLKEAKDRKLDDCEECY